MAIGHTVLELLVHLKRLELLQDCSAVIEIGAQQLNNSALRAKDEIAELGKLFGVESQPALSEPQPSWLLEGGQEHLAASAPRARELWTWLGFDYASVDIDGSVGSIPLDLNYDRTPPEMQGKYDLVTNFGTTEHVANQLNAFHIIHDLAAPGGLMIHELPLQGNLNHGLINYNYKFFWMLARSNGYKFIDATFTSEDHPYALPENISNFLLEFGKYNRRNYVAMDVGARLVLQKCIDIPFVPPIDVETGTKTENLALAERYWTVFQPEKAENLTIHTRPTRRGAPPSKGAPPKKSSRGRGRRKKS